ncbi:hypothetical protein [Halovivax sp.]|uniref:DUF7112 family protein n=1 Tax=Halovivax sp. TaxID=1935978 RepID=UPI0025B7BC27|nr:hypothetical protein [Halovivax sp.]
MADRISSDHPSVHTVRASAEPTATGRTLSIPTDERDRFPTDDVVRVVLDGDERFARVERALTGDELSVPGVYDAPRFAREPGAGDDRLAAWIADRSIPEGGSVLIDVVEAGFLYGLRAPGETAVYEAKEPPSDSLSSIAERLEE